MPLNTAILKNRTLSSPHHKNTLTSLIILSIFIFSCCLVSHCVLSINDVWLMIDAKRLLAGGTYRHDFMENNPPLIIFLSIIPILLSTALKTTITTAFEISIFLTSTLSLISEFYLLHRLFDEKQEARINIILITTAVIYWVLPAFAFGEREHLMVILTTPYLLILALRCEGKEITSGLAITIGFFAALGFGLKPHFLLSLLLIECYRWVRTKNNAALLTPELSAVIFTLLIYSTALILITPDYLTYVFPILWHFYLGYEKEPLLQLLTTSLFISILVQISVATYCTTHAKHKNALLSILLLQTTGLVFAFLIQGKIWFYHFYPLCAFALLSATVSLFSLDTFGTIAKIFIFSFLMYAFYFTILTVIEVNAAWYQRTYIPQHPTIQKIIQSTQHHDTIYFFTTELSDLTPIYQKTNALSPRFPAFWMLPGILNKLNDKKTEGVAFQAKEALLNAVANDFKKHHPNYVVVRTGKYQAYLYEPPYSTIKNFNYIDFFSKNAAFRKIWANYHLISKSDGFAIYSLRGAQIIFPQ